MPRKAPVPSHTQAPNVFYDEWIKEINSLAELKVVEVVIRNTFGWHVERVKMSLADIKTATGLSKSSTQDGVRRAIKDGYVARVSNGRSFAYEIPVDVPESGTCQNDEVVPEFGTRSYRNPVQSGASPNSVLKKVNKQPKPMRAERFMLPPDSMLEMTSEDRAWLKENAPYVLNVEQMIAAWYDKQAGNQTRGRTIEEWKATWRSFMRNCSLSQEAKQSRNGNGRASERPGWMASAK